MLQGLLMKKQNTKKSLSISLVSKSSEFDKRRVKQKAHHIGEPFVAAELMSA